MSNWPQCRWGKFLFKEAIAEYQKREGHTIVEIGTIRDTNPLAKDTDGWATFAWVGHGVIHCVDTDPKAIEIASRMVEGPDYYQMDGIEFLKLFEDPIDLLYLDGPDADKGGQQIALQMFNAAGMSKRGLILIDDCDHAPRWEGRGKGELVIPVALEQGWEILADNERQVLLGC